MSPVAELFAKYVKKGFFKIEQVPTAWRSQVEQILKQEEDGAGESEPLPSDIGTNASDRRTE